MECPKCGNKGSTVIDSRKVETNVFRIRVCKTCNYKFYTEETEIELEEADEYMAEIKRRQRAYAKTKKSL